MFPSKGKNWDIQPILDKAMLWLPKARWKSSSCRWRMIWSICLGSQRISNSTAKPVLSKNKPSLRSPTEVYYWVYVITHNLSYSSWCFYYTPGVSHTIFPQNGWFYGDQLVYLALINFWWRKWLDKDVKMTYFPLKRMVPIDLHWVGATLLRKFATTRHKIKGSVGTSLLNQSNNGTFGPRIRSNFGIVPPIKPTPHSFTFGDYGHIWNREKPSDH